MSTVKASSGNPSGSGTKPPAVAAGTGGERSSFSDKLRRYWIELAYEWRKITWPERKPWLDSTLVVFIFVLVLMAALFALDYIVGFALGKALGIGGSPTK